jgi:membrane protein DedA with SNARE-associated domain
MESAGGQLNGILSFLHGLGPLLLYVFLGAGSALENIFPPVPADTFVLIGALMAAGGMASAWAVFLVTWLSNTAAALLVYWMGRRFGQPFFQTGLGRHLLYPAQLRRMGMFYEKWGMTAIFFARFLPGLRAMVPVFAGVTHQRLSTVFVPVLLASGIWHGGLVWLGTRVGQKLPALASRLAGTNLMLLVVSLLVLVGVFFWWYRTRREGRGGRGE